MFSLALDVSRWIFRRIGWFLVIVAILWAGWLVQAQLKDLADLESNVQYLKNGESKLRIDLSELEAQTEQSVAKLKLAAATQLDQQIFELTKQIESNRLKLRELDGILTKLNPAKQIDVARLTIQIELATQELEHLHYLREISAQSSKLGRLAEDCEKVRQSHVGEWKAYQAADARLTSFNASASFQSQWNPLSAEFETREALEAAKNGHALNTQNIKTQYDQCLTNQATAQRVLNGLEKAKTFVLKNQITQAALTELDGHIQAIQRKADENWLKPILFDPLKQIFPIALGILATAICVPVAIKLCMYFLLAPLATRQSPICLQPNAGTRRCLEMPNSKSAVSLALEVAPDSELVVHPSYFHSAPARCTTAPRYVLNSQFFMTSLAAGMYNLTAVRSDQLFDATVSSGHDALAELLRFEIGDGESVCLFPRNLVGIIQKRSSPVRISSQWELVLQAWLTMQLRYLVFHGPASIIVKGCRGVRIESAVECRAIEQVSTVGFSANLNYPTSRTETFMAYLCGKKGLLRDRFAGQSGFYIFEEMPDPSKRSGITGKGLEGVTDAVLKLFGI